MKISQTGLDLIKEFEGFMPKAYLCPAGVATIGYGNTRYNDGTKVKMGDKPTTKAEATAMLETQVNEVYGDAVNRYVDVKINQNQFDALTSFTYNLGAGNLKSSTLLKRVNAERHDDAANEFLKWDKAGGKRLAGLTRRRKAERSLYKEAV